METKTSLLSRHARFRIALIIASERAGEKKTVKGFAEEHGVSTTTIQRMLNDDMTSARLDRAISSFIEEQMEYVEGEEVALTA